ncbi:MAG: ribonuclease domain-containing protein [Bacillota bacterium]|nr:ribonuclease domain-containing protein [Bacillota bacterium]
MRYSTKWETWKAELDGRTCIICKKNNGKIYDSSEPIDPKLPGYYITKKIAKQLGWKSFLGNLAQVAPGKMIFGGIHKNKSGRLPQKDGRVWYEADINYESGYRNTQRILFSNDGLIFATYNHYDTFIEIQ